IQASVAFYRRGRQLLGIGPQRCGFMRLRGPHAGPESYVNVARWTACLEDARPEETAILAELLDSRPGSWQAPALRDGWFTRVAFEDRDAIRLIAQSNWRHEVCGLFDPETASLALVDRDVVLSYGDPSCLHRLSAHLKDSQPVDFSALRIEAFPLGEKVEVGSALLLKRAEFQYLLTT
ncbi:MAG: hypothetical protein ACRD1G_14075, partial [Acidimicrobiales bacterium]